MISGPKDLVNWAGQADNNLRNNERAFNPDVEAKEISDYFRIITKGVSPVSLPVFYENGNIDGEEHIEVYANGSCTNNGDLNATAGSSIWFGDNDVRNMAYRLPPNLRTNNAAEVTAILIAVQKVSIKNSLKISTNSSYALNVLPQTCHKMRTKAG